MAGSLSSINIGFKVNLTELSSELQNATRQLQSTGDRMKGIGKSMSLYFTAPLAAAGVAGIHFASDFEESNNKVSVAFKESAAQVQNFAKTALKNFGIAEGSADDMAALFGDMGTSMGLTTGAAATMSTSLVALAGDLASFKNIGIDQASTALKGIFTGETESLKTLGIVMTEGQLAAFALSQGIKKNIKDFTQAEKVQLRYAFVMNNTKNAQGDFLRTGGGAANQMRVFTESMKELGVQFGQVILPAFTGLIKYVNGFVASIKEMNPALRTGIVIFGGIVAAAGPVILIAGSLITAFAQVRAAIAAVNFAPLLASLGPVAIGLAAAAAAFLIFRNQSKPLVDSQKALADVTKEAQKNIASEVLSLGAVVKVAKDKTLADAARKEAIDKLNSQYGIYNGNITLENVNTVSVTKSISEYIKAIRNKAIAQAAQSKVQELAAQMIAIEEKSLFEYRNTLIKTITDVESFLGVENKKLSTQLKNRQELENYIKQQKLSTDEAKKYRDFYLPLIKAKDAETRAISSQIDMLAKKGLLDKADVVNTVSQGTAVKKNIEYYEGLITELDNLNKTLDDPSAIKKNKAEIKLYQNEIEKLEGTLGKKGTIDWYEDQIKKIQELQNKFETTPEAVAALEERIVAFQKKIDALKGIRVPVVAVLDTVAAEGIETPKPKSQGTVDDYGSKIEALRELQTQVATTSEAYYDLERAIAETELERDIKFNFPTEEVNNFSTTYRNFGQNFKETGKQMTQSAAEFSESFSKSFQQLQVDALASFGQTIGQIIAGQAQLGDVFKGLTQLLGDFVVNIGKQLIAVGIASQAFQFSLASPLTAIAAGVATVAAGEAFKAAFAGKFADGGIVGGSSFHGDRLFARVNSGEMILNANQQKNLYSALEPRSSVNDVIVQLAGGFEIDGSSLRLVLDRADKKQNRLG